MKKQKMLKHVASVYDPSLEGSFSAPTTHSGEISVVFRGKSISIHGWDGSSWTTIHTSNGIDPQFKFENTYQNYYLKSLTGQEETIPVSFFSTDKYEGSTPLLAGVNREVKLYDVEEVPIYTAADVNKMLTVMSNGSLAWLLANESFVIDEEGGGIQQPPPPPANMVGLEEDAGLILHGNAQLVNGVLELDGSAGTYASLPHSTDYERESGDMTVSFWFNANSLPGTNNGWGLIAKSTGQHAWDGWVTAYSTQGSGIGGSGPQMTTGGIGTYIDQTGVGKPSHNYRAAPAGGLPPGVWHHVAVTMPATGDYSIFANGESILSWSPASRNTSTNTNLLFGGIMTDGVTKFFSGKIDGVTIQKQILTAQEISDLHAAGRGGPGEGSSEPESSANMVGLEEDASATLHGNAQLIDGVLHVDGTDGTYLSLPHSEDFDKGNGDLSINLWFNANSLPNEWNSGLVSKMGGGWSGWLTAISTLDAEDGTGLMPEGGIQTTMFGGGGGDKNDRSRVPGGVTLNTWHHVAFVMPAVGDFKMYFNGQEVHSYVPFFRDSVSSGDLRIGGWGPVNGFRGFFDGMIDGVFVEKKVLTAQEVSDLHAAGRGESEPAQTSTSFIEDDPNFITTTGNVVNGIYVEPGSQAGNYGRINLSSAGIVDYTNGETTEDEFTISWWMNLEPSQAASNFGIAGEEAGFINGVNRNFLISLGGADLGMTNPDIRVNMGGTVITNNDVGIVMGDAWTHCAVVCKSDGSQLVVSVYLNGSKLPNTKTKPLGTKILPPETVADFGFGGNGTSTSAKGQFDSMQIKSGIALADAQVAAIAAQSDRQMSIEQAAIVSEPTQAYLEETATLYGDASVSGGTLVLDGNGDYAVIDDGFRFTDVLSTSIWFKTTATGDRRIYSSHVRGMSGDDFKNGFFARLNNGQLKYRHPSGGTAELTGPSGLNDGQWHHMAVTWENNVGYTLYVDGSQIATGAAGASDGYVSGWGLYIGANPWLNNNPYALFVGEVSKFEVLNEVLTAQDVTDRYNAGRGVTEPAVLEVIGSTPETFVRANGDFSNFGDNVDYDRSTNEDFAVELDVNFASLPNSSSSYDIIGKGRSFPWYGWALIAYAPGGTQTLRMWANTSQTEYTSSGMDVAVPLVTNQWYNIKAVWKWSGVQQLWVDGTKVAERTMASSYMPPIDSAYDLKIGGAFTDIASRTFDGQIRNVVIYKGDSV